MQTPIKWINELVNVDSIKLNDLIEKLTLGGFEVEEILELDIENQKQLALDISSTANRSDSLSIQGISKEISTLLDKPIIISDYSFKNFDWRDKLSDYSTIIDDDYSCSTFLSIIVRNLENFTPPKWLKQKLISAGLTPENNLTDFQNYIILETGYPFAFYDFEKICSKLECENFKLSFSKAINHQLFYANNGLEYKLTSSNILLNADNLPISIAGIIENNKYSYSNTTTSLLIEGSIFNAAKIRQQSRSLGLRTDRSARYEKSLKDTYLMESLYRLISLLKISNPNLTCELHTFAKAVNKIPIPIILRYQTVREILGPINQQTQKESTYISPEQITNYLTRLNFEFIYDNSELNWKVQIPDDRTDDITREIDLIEEIGRLHGFNNFLTTLPKIKTIGNKDASYQTRSKITTCLLNLGFNELIHYSLVSDTTFINNEIKLINPLLSDCSSLRASLLPNLIKTIQENLKQGNLPIEGFEYGHVFSGKEAIQFKETECVAGIFGGIKKKLSWSDSEKALSWFEAKGKIEQLFEQLNLSTYWKASVSDQNPILHTYRNAEIYLANGKKLGIFGQIHPIFANKGNLSPETYLFEFNLEVIQDQLQKNKLTSYKEYSSYPKIIKDLSFIIEQNISFEELQILLYANGTEFLSEIKLLDEYRGNSIPENHTSLCLQFVFQSKQKTLKNKDVDNILHNLQLVLTDKFNAIIRN